MSQKSSRAYLNLELGYLDDEGNQVQVDSPEFHNWLQNNDSFRVEAGENSYRARKENYTGTDYWYGVKKVAGKLHKRFIAKTEELKSDRLRKVAGNIRQLSAKSPTPTKESPTVEVVQTVDQTDLKQEIVALKAQVSEMQQQLTRLLELQGKEVA